MANLLYCNNNPHGTPCAVCRQYIGRIFVRGTEPHLPIHDHCYCYYVETTQPPNDNPITPDPEPTEPDSPPPIYQGGTLPVEQYQPIDHQPGTHAALTDAGRWSHHHLDLHFMHLLTQHNVSGARDDDENALANLLTALEHLGLTIDNTTAS